MGPFYPIFIWTGWWTGRGDKISSGNPGFERAVLPGAQHLQVLHTKLPNGWLVSSSTKGHDLLQQGPQRADAF